MIHYSKLQEILAAQRSVAITFIATDGRRINIQDAECISYHSEGTTFNVKIKSSNQVRSIKKLSVIEINGEEVCL